MALCATECISFIFVCYVLQATHILTDRHLGAVPCIILFQLSLRRLIHDRHLAMFNTFSNFTLGMRWMRWDSEITNFFIRIDSQLVCRRLWQLLNAMSFLSLFCTHSVSSLLLTEDVFLSLSVLTRQLTKSFISIASQSIVIVLCGPWSVTWSSIIWCFLLYE